MKELHGGHLDLLLLAVVARQPAHGYALISEVRRRTRGALDLAEGTLYPALHRLERDGLVTSRWATERGRKRRTYRATKAGRIALGERVVAWRNLSEAVDAVLKGA
jgi:DNA-binding PadR family transcriptional regulator